MRIIVTSIFVDDQEKALQFYTNKLGFVTKNDIPLGEHRWLTVVGPNEPDGVEIVLEPAEHPAVKPFQSKLVEDGIPFTMFGVDDIQAEYDRMVEAGVNFVQPPQQMGNVIMAVFDDTCGNLISMAQMLG